MYELIRANKRNAFLLVLILLVLLVGMGYSFGVYWGHDPYPGVIFAVLLALISGLVSYYSGDTIMLLASSAHEIQKADAPQLYNVVEEMTIAAGVPMPRIYIIEDSAPNAFATGRNPEHATIAVTRGLLDKLDRSELQGVVAHELSHVRNYDILYATMVGVLVGTIALLADMFWRSTWFGAGRRRSRDDNGGGGGQVIFLVLAILFAILAPLCAMLLQMAVSRQREYLADASAAALTRYPEGLASALEKIAGDKEVLEVANRATQHLYIVNPIKSFEARSSNLFSTHPPIMDRIARLRAIGTTGA